MTLMLMFDEDENLGEFNSVNQGKLLIGQEFITNLACYS